jgi:hypothetical protein
VLDHSRHIGDQFSKRTGGAVVGHVNAVECAAKSRDGGVHGVLTDVTVSHTKRAAPVEMIEPRVACA